MAPPALRSSYADEASLRVFFTGGVARLSPDGTLLASMNGDDATLVEARGGAVVATLEGDSEPLTALAYRCGGWLCDG